MKNKAYGRYDFLALSKPFAWLSAGLTMASLVIVALQGFNYGIDFAGGTEVQVQFQQTVPTARVRQFIQDKNYNNAVVQALGSSLATTSGDASSGDTTTSGDADDNATTNADGVRQPIAAQGTSEFLIRLESLQGETDRQTNQLLNEQVARVTTDLNEYFAAEGPQIRRVDSVGPQIGSELKRNGLLAAFYSLLLILIYIGLRFDYKYAPGAVFCLFHDAAITLGIFSLFGREVNVQTMAAILTIIGYSLNDTIVTFDRIRENVPLMRDFDFRTILNRSLNDVLSRTLLTSATTLIAVLAMYFLAEGVIEDFAFTLGIGVVVGTYSSMYVASPLVLLVDRLTTTS